MPQGSPTQPLPGRKEEEDVREAPSCTIFLDTVTVELTSGSDLVAKPYDHSVSGRHMMLSQAGTLWKATRSAREKRFYATIVAAATGHWKWLAAEEAEARREMAGSAGKTASSGEAAAFPVASEAFQGPVPEAHHEAYAAAALALAPFLPRYYGTRNVASLKVGSIGFSEARDEDMMAPGEYEGEASKRSHGNGTAGVGGSSTHLDEVAPTGSFSARLGSGSTSPLQPLLSSHTPLNASRVVVHTDAVKQVMVQFAKDKKDAVADLQRRGEPDDRIAEKAEGNKRGKKSQTLSTPPAMPHTATDAGLAERVDRDTVSSPCSGAPGCEEVVAVATAQIAEELNRRLPPRHPDRDAEHASNGTTAAGESTLPPASSERIAANATANGSASSPTPASASGATSAALTTTRHPQVRNEQETKKIDAATPTAAAAVGDGWVEMIVLQDVCYGFAYPCVLDVKMGTRQYGLHAKSEKIAEKEHKAEISTSKRHGIRLAGFKRWSATHQAFEVKSKHDLFTLDFAEVTAMLHYFLSSYQPPSANTQTEEEAAEAKAAVAAAVRAKLTEQLKRLLAAFKAHGVFRFYTSSLLLAYDAADPVRTVRAVMVDFAYAYEQHELEAAGDPDAALDVDEGYIVGIEALIEALQTST